MKDKTVKSIKPRSTRYTQEQEQFFESLERMGINVSHWLRAVVDKNMPTPAEQAKTAN